MNEEISMGLGGAISFYAHLEPDPLEQEGKSRRGKFLDSEELPAEIN